MNTQLLSQDVQDYLRQHLKSDIAQLSLKGSPFKAISTAELMQQLVGLQKSESKLPTWHTTEDVLFPPKLNLEQTSSEATAHYKASLVSGQSIIDITGGFGVDTYAFSAVIKNVTHCEKNESLITLAKHNAKVFNRNITFRCGDGLSVLKDKHEGYDWIYLDPSRRHNIKGKVFLLKDCEPDLPQHLQFLFTKAPNILVKTSPLLDITSGLRELNHVKEIHCVAVNNEVKELLWILSKETPKDYAPSIKTVNLQGNNTITFEGRFNKSYETSFNTPENYLYEPNAAIMKSGLFSAVSEKLNVNKLHKHTHLYTSNQLINFPGRRFQINNCLAFNKKTLKKIYSGQKANIAVRHFPMTVAQLKKKLNISDGGHTFLFFTTTLNGEKICLACSKV